MKRPAILTMAFLLLAPMHASNKSGLTNEERLTHLEDFEQQQRDYNHGMDEHLTKHIDDILRQQGEQNTRIKALEDRVVVVYAYGQELIWVVGMMAVGFPALYIFYDTRRYNKHEKRQAAVEEMKKDLFLIKVKLGIED
jgi:hypothetical protein